MERTRSGGAECLFHDASAYRKLDGRGNRRSQARRDLTSESLTEVMGDRTWNADRAAALVDEHPDAYKSIDQVMADQEDLVKVEHMLRQIFNYKG